MPKKEMIGAHKPGVYTGGGPFVRSTRNILPGFKRDNVRQEIYLAAKRVQARPMRALQKSEPLPEPEIQPVVSPLAPVIPMTVTATTQPKQLSRQQLWMQRQVKAGKCRRCGAKRTIYAQYCDNCMGKVRDHRSKVGNEKRPGRPLKK